jgi:hypothetical protein
MTYAFISYSRRNLPFAERLYYDLRRAGVDCWLDRSDIPADARWEDEIRAAIHRATHFLLLASPESGRSAEVRKELAEADALARPVLTLRVGGADADLPEDWRRRQFLYFHDGYWGGLAALLTHLRAPRPLPPSLADLLNRGPTTVAAAAAELDGAGPPLGVAGRDYRSLPVEPSGYAMTWLVGPADAALALPPRLAVLLKFSGQASRGDTLPDVINYLAASGVADVWVVCVRGPRNAQRDHELPLDARHVWDDAARAATRALRLDFMRGKELHLFLESPQALVYEVASQFRDMAVKHIYQLNYRPTGAADRYVPVLGPNPA